MFYNALVIVLVILVIWLMYESWVGSALYIYTMSFVDPSPMMMTVLHWVKMSRWHVSKQLAKKHMADILRRELDMNAQMSTQMPAALTSVTAPAQSLSASSGAVAAPAPAVAQAPSTVGPTSSATAAPTPKVEKFRTNLAHMYGSQGA